MNLRAYKSCFTCIYGRFFPLKIILYICFEVYSLFMVRLTNIRLFVIQVMTKFLKCCPVFPLPKFKKWLHCQFAIMRWIHEEWLREEGKASTQDIGGGRIRIPVVMNPKPRWQEKIDHWFLHIPFCATWLPDLFETIKLPIYMQMFKLAGWIVY